MRFSPPVRLFLLFILCAHLLSACSLVGLGVASAPAAADKGDSPRYQVPADATATPTPFQPLPPTPTYLPASPTLAETLPPTPFYAPPSTATPTALPTPTATPVDLGDYPPPSVWPSIPLPPPVGLLPQPEGQVNILLLGSDQIPGDYGFRTDSILLLTLNTERGTANLTSFPRDLYVYIPGWTVNRINTAMAYGGFETLAMTFEYNLGVRPDHFVMINFWSFVEVVDSLGGVDIPVSTPLPNDCAGVPPGVFHMNGEVLLCYVRERQTTSDFDRARRQQEVLQALLQRILSLDIIARAPELYRIYVQNVTTDMKFSNVAPLLPLAISLSDTARIHHYYISHGEVSDWITPAGAMVLLPNREAILEVMRQALNSP